MKKNLLLAMCLTIASTSPIATMQTSAAIIQAMRQGLTTLEQNFNNNAPTNLSTEYNELTTRMTVNELQQSERDTLTADRFQDMAAIFKKQLQLSEAKKRSFFNFSPVAPTNAVAPGGVMNNKFVITLTPEQFQQFLLSNSAQQPLAITNNATAAIALLPSAQPHNGAPSAEDID